MDDVLREVPANLKKLVCYVGRAFYQSPHIVCLDVLSKYPCVTETDLAEVLKMQGSQKQLRQTLTYLKKDKLVKSVQKMESEGRDDHPNKHSMKMVHYYYINYKQFVNVVKYKLDQMRKKIESEEKRTKNRTSYTCSSCKSNFSDLDVDRLYDPTEGLLRCSFCRNTLEEDEQQSNDVDARTLISRLNEQMKPITDLLRETENLNLAPELLEPEVQSIQKYLQSNDAERRISSSGRDPSGWASRNTTDLYGDSTAISVNIRDEHVPLNKLSTKERPEWMVKSTVHPSGNHDAEPSSIEDKSSLESRPSGNAGNQILADLITYEKSIGGGNEGVGDDVTQHYYSSSSSGDEDNAVLQDRKSIWSSEHRYDQVEEFDDDSSEDERYSVRIGDRVVDLQDVNDNMVAQMTDEEKERYKSVYQLAMSQADY